MQSMGVQWGRFVGCRPQVRLQHRTMLKGHDTGNLRVRRIPAAWAAGGADPPCCMVGQRCTEGVEEDSRSGCAHVVRDRVVDHVDGERILERDTGSIPAGNVVRDDVVGEGYPCSNSSGEVGNAITSEPLT